MSDLSHLIARLQRGIARNASYVKTILHPQLLVMSLQELHDLIGNDDVKDSVATQVSHLIMVRRRAQEHTTIKEDEVMLNTKLEGPPGVGKTLIATKLAKIWYSLGYLHISKPTEDKQELRDMLKDLLKTNDSDGTGSSANDGMTLYIFLLFIIILITVMSMIWSFYTRFGGVWTAIGIVLLLILIIAFAFFISASVNDNNDTNNIQQNINGQNNNVTGPFNKGQVNSNNEQIGQFSFPNDSELFVTCSRQDFIDKYVGWTAQKVLKFVKQHKGKVIFVDEAYSLINGPHDEFGMEALTTLNLYMSQHPRDNIFIFAGYRDLLETGPFAAQPGLKRRFMWQFNCNGYNGQQLFEIFKVQLAKKGWGVNKEQEVRQLFVQNADAFQGFGGDTERAAFFAELEHSRDFISNENGLSINMLEPHHVRRGIQKLRDNNPDSSDIESTNPLANMMKLISSSKTSKKSDKSSVTVEDMDLINAMRDHAINTART